MPLRALVVVLFLLLGLVNPGRAQVMWIDDLIALRRGTVGQAETYLRARGWKPDAHVARDEATTTRRPSAQSYVRWVFADPTGTSEGALATLTLEVWDGRLTLVTYQTGRKSYYEALEGQMAACCGPAQLIPKEEGMGEELPDSLDGGNVHLYRPLRQGTEYQIGFDISTWGTRAYVADEQGQPSAYTFTVRLQAEPAADAALNGRP